MSEAFRLVARGSEEYPPALEALEPPPAPLWVTGQSPSRLGPCVAVVGARNATPYGLEVARMLAADLAAAGVCVVSGMARGIDRAAHEGALAVSGGATLAVLGTGIDVVHPPSAAPLRARLAERGTLLTQFPPGTRGYKSNFRVRNRTIAALTLGVVVVQGAHPTSGSLITAAAAAQLGRTVFAVPGDIRSVASSGPHALLRDGARICAAVGDVLEELAPELRRAAALAAPPAAAGLPEVERAVLAALADEPDRADGLVARTRLDAPTVARALVRLEVANLVIRQPGGTFTLRAPAAPTGRPRVGPQPPGVVDGRVPAVLDGTGEAAQ